nr:unnamed protein product [Callosobruchus chinensis]
MQSFIYPRKSVIFVDMMKRNFKELIDFLKTYDQKLERFLSEATVFVGTSKSIQNDLIESISSVVKCKIHEELLKFLSFSVTLSEVISLKDSQASMMSAAEKMRKVYISY